MPDRRRDRWRAERQCAPPRQYPRTGAASLAADGRLRHLVGTGREIRAPDLAANHAERDGHAPLVDGIALPLDLAREPIHLLGRKPCGEPARQHIEDGFRIGAYRAAGRPGRTFACHAVTSP
jgi:hypothetical protein